MFHKVGKNSGVQGSSEVFEVQRWIKRFTFTLSAFSGELFFDSHSITVLTVGWLSFAIRNFSGVDKRGSHQRSTFLCKSLLLQP